MILAQWVGLAIVVMCMGLLWLLRDRPRQRQFLGYDKAGRPMFDEPCCDPDYDPARGGFVHADSCKGDIDG